MDTDTNDSTSRAGGNHGLPRGYKGVKRSARPINDSPLQSLMIAKRLSLYKIEEMTGITTGMLSCYAKNQSVPGYIHAMRMQVHLGIPFESWMGTTLGKLMWEESEPDVEARKAQRAKWWRNWAKNADHYNKLMMERKRQEYIAAGLPLTAIDEKLVAEFLSNTPEEIIATTAKDVP